MISSVDVTFDVVMFDVRCLFVYTGFRRCGKAGAYLRFDVYPFHFTSWKKRITEILLIVFKLFLNIGFTRLMM